MSEVLDQGAIDNLLAMVGDDPDFVDELADSLLADAPNLLGDLRAAVAASDAAALVRPAHTLKGMSLNIGAVRVAELARELEEQARAGSLDGADGLVPALADAVDELVVELAAARERRWRAD